MSSFSFLSVREKIFSYDLCGIRNGLAISNLGSAVRDEVPRLVVAVKSQWESLQS